MNETWRSRITIEPGKRGGRPCIRGMRITVYDVLSYLADGMTVTEILDDFPYLTPEDIQACFAFAAEHQAEIPTKQDLIVDVPPESQFILHGRNTGVETPPPQLALSDAEWEALEVNDA